MEFVTGFGTLFGFLQAASQLPRPRSPSRDCTILIYLISACSNLRFTINYVQGTTVIHYLDVPLGFSLAFVLYLFVKRMLLKEPAGRIIPGVLLALLGVSTALLVVLHLTAFNPGTPPQSFARALIFLGVVLFVDAGIVWVLRHLWIVLVENLKSRAWAFHILLFWLLAMISTNIRVLTTFVHIWDVGASEIAERIGVIGEVLSVVYLSLIWSRYPEVLGELSNNVRKKAARYSRSSLVSTDLAGLEQRLDEVVAEKVYCDEDLTLARLASMLSVTPHQLSEFLNARRGVGFSRFINAHRVSEAVAVLADEPSRPIGSVGSAVGFSSSSAFFRAFKSEKGVTPSEYRKLLGRAPQ